MSFKATLRWSDVSVAICDAHRSAAKLVQISVRVTVDFGHTKAHSTLESVEG
jgi:hypothetical protein